MTYQTEVLKWRGEVGGGFIENLGIGWPGQNHIGPWMTMVSRNYVGDDFEITGAGAETSSQNPICLTCRGHELHAGGNGCTSRAAIVVASSGQGCEHPAAAGIDLQDGVEITAACVDAENSAHLGRERVPDPFAEIGLANRHWITCARRICGVHGVSHTRAHGDGATARVICKKRHARHNAQIATGATRTARKNKIGRVWRYEESDAGLIGCTGGPRIVGASQESE